MCFIIFISVLTSFDEETRVYFPLFSSNFCKRREFFLQRGRISRLIYIIHLCIYICIRFYDYIISLHLLGLINKIFHPMPTNYPSLIIGASIFVGAFTSMLFRSYYRRKNHRSPRFFHNNHHHHHTQPHGNMQHSSVQNTPGGDGASIDPSYRMRIEPRIFSIVPTLRDDINGVRLLSTITVWEEFKLKKKIILRLTDEWEMLGNELKQIPPENEREHAKKVEAMREVHLSFRGHFPRCMVLLWSLMNRSDPPRCAREIVRVKE